MDDEVGGNVVNGVQQVKVFDVSNRCFHDLFRFSVSQLCLHYVCRASIFIRRNIRFRSRVRRWRRQG